MKLKAVYNAIIVKPIELGDEYHGNIIVPDLGSEKNKMGEVISVLPTMGFTRFEFKGEDYFIGPENQILALLEEQED